ACLMLVEPAGETIVLPLRSLIEPIFDSTFETKRLAVRKCVFVYQTCGCRSAMLVVLPHSRSIVPLANNGMRVEAVTSVRKASSSLICNSRFLAATILAQA